MIRQLNLSGLLMAMVFTASLRAAPSDSTATALASSFIWTGQSESQQKRGDCVGFRKTFQVASPGARTIMHVYADARYVLWINGDYVERGPSRFEPAAPEYDSIDITRHLRSGDNSIAILVISRISNGKVRMHSPGLTARVERAAKILCGTDDTWKWSDQTSYRQVTTDWANMFDVIDSRVGGGDWTRADYDDSKWTGARLLTQKTWGPLSASRIPLLREMPVEPAWNGRDSWPVTLNAGESLSFKFPRMVLAYAEIDVDAEEGSELQLTWTPQTRITCRAGRQKILTTDTHSIHEGGVRVKTGRAVLHGVKFIERLYPFDRTGSFQCSDPLLNKLWTTCVRGLEVTSEDAYVDCTDRERVEWMDCDPPAFDVTRVAMTGRAADGSAVHADPRLLEVMLRRTALTLQPGGWVKAHTCSDRFDIHAKMEDRACDWVQGARRYYESCGRTEVIGEIWPAVVAQMNYFLDRRTARGLVLAREWVVWGNPVGYQTCEGTALNAFVCRALADAAFLGGLIGEKKQARAFEQASADLARAINTRLWDEKAGTYFGGYYDLADAKKAPDYRKLNLKVEDNRIEPTRHAALFALDQGVVPPDRRDGVVKYLMANPPRENDIMQYYYYFKVQYAVDDPGQDLAVQEKMRAEWKDMAISPYEATFEGLHSWGSQAHGYGMFPAFFLSSHVLGVRLDGPAQNRTILIEPRLAGLTDASGSVGTEFGPVRVCWKHEPGGWRFDIDTSGLSKGVSVRLHLPVGNGELSAELDGKNLKVGRGKVQWQGRWLEVPLAPGKHQGSWKTPVVIDIR